jgi:hypothetical protein
MRSKEAAKDGTIIRGTAIKRQEHLDRREPATGKPKRISVAIKTRAEKPPIEFDVTLVTWPNHVCGP